MKKMTANDIKILHVHTAPEPDPYHADTRGLTTTMLYIDPEDRTCWIDQDDDDNATPSDEWYGLRLAYPIDTHLDAPSVSAYLRGEGQAILSRILAEYTTWWRDSNLYGGLSPDGEVFMERLVNKLNSLVDDTTGYWYTSEWLDPLSDDELGICATTTDERLSQIADEQEKMATDNDAKLLDDPVEYLERRRAYLREE